MNIAEFFVTLGVKGAEKTIGALGNVAKGMGELVSSSLALKAALVTALYALERMMSASAKTGTGLENFGELTGLSVQKLQQWQYAARQAGVSSEELTGNLKGVQSSMSKMLMGEGAPKGLALIASATKDFDISRARDTFYVMDQLQKAAKVLPQDIGNEALKSFGLTEGAIAAMRRGVFNAQNFSKAPLYSDREIGQLDKVNVAWGNLGTKIEMLFGKMTAKHGLQLVQDIEKITDAIIRLVEGLSYLADKLKVFEIIGGTVGVVADAINMKENKFLSGLASGAKNAAKENLPGVLGFLGRANQGYNFPKAATPSAPRGLTGPSKTQNHNVTQNLIFQHDGKNAQKTADSTRQAVQRAYRQMPQAQGG